MTDRSPQGDVYTTSFRNYWWISSLGGLYFVVGFILWGGTRAAVLSSAVFVAAGAIGLAVHYLLRSASRHQRQIFIVAHLLIGYAVLVWQQASLPLTDYTATGDPTARSFLIYLVSALIAVTMSMFGGWWGALLGLAMHYTFILDAHEEFSFKWVFPILIALLGVIISTAFWRLDDAYRRLEQMASYDPLTGLLNRHRLTAEFERLQTVAREHHRQLLLIAWDLDELKVVNDTRGHAAGDGHLCEFARALGTHVRKTSSARTGDAAFRVGGDEFLSLHLDGGEGDALVSRVRRAFPGVSAGWVDCEFLTLDQAMTQADAALYLDKDARKRASPLA